MCFCHESLVAQISICSNTFWLGRFQCILRLNKESFNGTELNWKMLLKVGRLSRGEARGD